MIRRRVLSEQDRQTWARYAQHVVPLPGVAPLPLPAEAEVEAASAVSAGADAGAAGSRDGVRPPSPPVSRALAPLEVGTAPGGVDRSTWSRFRTGKLSPVRTLDLHGRTLQRAHADLHGFLFQAAAERLRCVEVITGRGSGETGGAIRREFPLWINGPALRPVVLAASHPHPANPGSVRLLLRRVR